jgi:hypothetical protein
MPAYPVPVGSGWRISLELSGEAFETLRGETLRPLNCRKTMTTFARLDFMDEQMRTISHG